MLYVTFQIFLKVYLYLFPIFNRDKIYYRLPDQLMPFESENARQLLVYIQIYTLFCYGNSFKRAASQGIK